MASQRYRIAVIPGGGIGIEVTREGVQVLQAVCKRFGIGIEYRHIEWASCDYYERHGQMMPNDWKAQLGSCDAILFGAVGWPDRCRITSRCGAHSSNSAVSSTST